MSGAQAPRQFVSDLMSTATVIPALTGRNREEVLAELVSKVPGISSQAGAHGKLLQALLDRERLFSTGIGDGVALPHARNVLPGIVGKPVVVFGRHRDGVDYAAIDGRVAKLFFLLVSIDVAEHLQILARVSRLVRTKGFREGLFAAGDTDSIIRVIREEEGLPL
jgi:mannitol/fructose-specific phosphotransferase system IIA component (Ntr-type)